MIHAPAAMVDVEIGRESFERPHLPPHAHFARMLVRMHGHPIAVIDCPAASIDDLELRDVIMRQQGDAVRRHLDTYHTSDGGPEACSWRVAIPGKPPAATIVINSCAASAGLARTIESALAQDYTDAHVLVVDNRPETSGIDRMLARDFGDRAVGYVAAPKPGLGRARNAGLFASTTEIVAFTDDDVVLDERWLGWLVAGFYAIDSVACVTGLIVPLELETEAQVFMEEFSGFGKGFDRRVWDRDEHRLDHPLYPYTVGLFGSGASAAFRRETLVAAGGFDPHLGIGTPAIGGEDIDMYTRLVLDGHRIVYQPASVLRHLHRREMRAADRQIHGYGAGLTAMLTKHVVTGAQTRRAVLMRIPAGLRYAVSPRSPKNARKPREFTFRQSLLEWAGMAYGPIGYFRSRLAG